MSGINPRPLIVNLDKDPEEISSEFYNYFKSNRTSFVHIINLPQNNLILLLNLVITLSIRPNEFKSYIVNDILGDVFFDKLVKFLRHLNSIVIDEFRTLVKFYEVIVHNLPICDIAYSKISALLHLTYECMNENASGICNPYLLERLQELLQLVDGKKYLKDRCDLHYTDIDIYPSPIDFYETRFMKPSIIDGPYGNSEQYLDIQFKLMREDYICAVRESIETIRSETIGEELIYNLYKNVKSTKLNSCRFPSSKICHWLKFSENDEIVLEKEDWASSKKFMNGSLLFFTQNNFVTFIVATVEENLISFTEGKVIAIKVSIIGNPYLLKVESYYDMYESRVFFEPYYHSLKCLQRMNPYNFPLGEEILKLSNEIVPISISKSPPGNFRYEGTDLNKSQIEALNAALSHKFSLIQGPPGTGKSHLTREIIKILVKDSTDTRPVLVICMRNRALDNILEPLAKLGLKVIRFGMTENEVLSNCSESKWKKKFKKNMEPNAEFLRKSLTSLRKIINDKRNVNNPAAVECASELHKPVCAASRLLNDYYYGKMFLSQKVQVIGATSTGAAKRNLMFSEMNPKAVIIEEAAEILEASLIASLPMPCDHLILVGDHLQLRPTPASHISAVKYKMNVSLFERLIKNGKGYHSLRIQHRLRPEIAELICPLIYKDLMNDPSVYRYPDILGVAKNVFFLTHSHKEEFLAESTSYINHNEMIFLLSFANYLVKQGYSTNAITILAAYSAQLTYFKKNSTKYPLIQGIQIQSIDNYQGDENEIILLSLVRSDGDSIGFLRIANRVNVALSRAKAGFYMMGNADTLSSYSKLWGDICHLLNKKNCIGEAIPLKCKIHKQISCVSKPEEINNLTLGGCKSRCNIKKECGHICKKQCHASLNLHDRVWCNKKCLRKVCASHYCSKRCNEECGPCQMQNRIQLGCGHFHFIECSSSAENFKCTQPCSRKPCGYHKCKKLCYEECGPCKKKRTFSLSCGHSVELECSSEPAYIQCTKPCNRKSCDKHDCIKLCYEACTPCEKVVPYRLKCGHLVSLKCSINVKDYACEMPCYRFCARDLHHCRKLCFEKCEPCLILTKFRLTCGHVMEGPCGLDVKNYQCPQPCRRMSSCGFHQCSVACGIKPCPPCKKKIMRKPICGHFYVQLCSDEPDPFCTFPLVPVSYKKCPHSFYVSCYESNHVIAPLKCYTCQNNEWCLIL